MKKKLVYSLCILSAFTCLTTGCNRVSLNSDSKEEAKQDNGQLGGTGQENKCELDEILKQILEEVEVGTVGASLKVIPVTTRLMNFASVNGDSVDTLLGYMKDYYDGLSTDEKKIFINNFNVVYDSYQTLLEDEQEGIIEDAGCGTAGYPWSKEEVTEVEVMKEWVDEQSKEAGEENSAEDGWKKAYVAYFENLDKDAYEGYNLLYINNNEIPEIAMYGNSEAIGTKILYYNEDGVQSVQLNRRNFTYIPRSGMFCNSDGVQDTYWDIIYTYTDGNYGILAQGSYGNLEGGPLRTDADGLLIYEYAWMDQKVSKEEYESKKDACYDVTKSEAGYTQEKLTLEELLAGLQ